MELEDLIDKYRTTKRSTRALLILFAAVLPALYVWMNEGERLDLLKTQIEAEVNEERSKFEAARQKSAELPALLTKLTAIEDELKKATQILPDKVQIDAILAALGNLEKELDVKLIRFTPGQEMQPNPQLEYMEIPIDLVLQAPFAQTMRFLDRLVHMPNLTHIRNIQFNQKADTGGRLGSSPNLETSAKLILFKGM